MTQAYVLPTIGSSGSFKLAPPFDAKMGVSERYTVKSIRTISEIEANSVDVKKIYYLDNGLTELDYIQHVEVDMQIVSLQSGYGQWIEVPAVYILEMPKIDGVPYQKKNIIISLPPIPTDMQISVLAQDLQDTATLFIGAEASHAIIDVSTVLAVDKDTHETVKAERVAAMAASDNPAIRLKEKEAYIDLLLAKIARLEKYIIDNNI